MQRAFSSRFPKVETDYVSSFKYTPQERNIEPYTTKGSEFHSPEKSFQSTLNKGGMLKTISEEVADTLSAFQKERSKQTEVIDRMREQLHYMKNSSPQRQTILSPPVENATFFQKKLRKYKHKIHSLNQQIRELKKSIIPPQLLEQAEGEIIGLRREIAVKNNELDEMHKLLQRAHKELATTQKRDCRFEGIRSKILSVISSISEDNDHEGQGLEELLTLLSEKVIYLKEEKKKTDIRKEEISQRNDELLYCIREETAREEFELNSK